LDLIFSINHPLNVYSNAFAETQVYYTTNIRIFFMVLLIVSNTNTKVKSSEKQYKSSPN